MGARADLWHGPTFSRGLLANFRRGRARLDVGLMLNQLGTLKLSGTKTLTLSGTKVWFQFKVPRSVRVVDTLARKASGKGIKFRLRQAAAEL